MSAWKIVIGLVAAIVVTILVLVCVKWPVVTWFVAPLATIILALFSPLRWYVALLLSSYDFVFTTTQEGYFKEVVRFGGHRKTILSKEDHIIDVYGDIVESTDGLPETILPGGLRLVGWPFIDRVLARNMEFLKSLPNGEVKSYDVKDVSEFYAKVDYPYALPFVKCEDKNNLPLLGHATLLAHVLNPRKSLFATANFYDTMVGLVLPSVRECLKGYSFDELKGKDDLDEIIWKKLQELNPRSQGDVCVIDELRVNYGIVIVALRIVNIDPPEEFRKATLTRWSAEREADAAEAVATAESRKAAGPIDIAMEKWVRSEMEEGETLADAKKRLREIDEYQEQRALFADQINRSRRTVQERKVDFTSGGKALAGGSIAEIAGTITAAIVGAVAGKNIKDDADQSGNPAGGQGNQGQQGGKNPKDMTPEELEEFYQNWRKGKKP